jgi:N-acetylglucosamine malate deacetylase 1
MKKVLVISPHPDDETLGCGGTLFRHKHDGDEIYWGIITKVSVGKNWSEKFVNNRIFEIASVQKKYGFSEIFDFGLPSIKIDTLPFSDIVEKITDIYKKIEPEIIYMPFAYDVHTDHQIIAKAMQATFKWFRYPHIQKVLMYETLSETEFNFIEKRTFSPNVFVNISDYLDEKIDTMQIYESEIAEFPFPRSVVTIQSLAALRGSQSGYEAAEAFELVYERK